MMARTESRVACMTSAGVAGARRSSACWTTALPALTAMALTSGHWPSRAETSSPLAATGQSRRCQRGAVGVGGRRRARCRRAGRRRCASCRRRWLGPSGSWRRAPRYSRRCRHRGTKSARTFRSFLVGSSSSTERRAPSFPHVFRLLAAESPRRQGIAPTSLARCYRGVSSVRQAFNSSLSVSPILAGERDTFMPARFHRRDLVLGAALTARNYGARMAHRAAFGCRQAGDEAGHRFLAARAWPRR